MKAKELAEWLLEHPELEVTTEINPFVREAINEKMLNYVTYSDGEVKELCISPIDWG